MNFVTSETKGSLGLQTGEMFSQKEYKFKEILT